MAAIVVEDGTGLVNSNSYISEAELTAYATDRGATLTSVAATLLIQGMDYIESKLFQGFKYGSTQALLWPRGNVIIDGYSVSSATIPQLLKDGLAEVCISIDGGVNPLATQGRETIKEKVGDIEVEYKNGSRPADYLTGAETKLKKLLKNSGASLSVFRG